MAKRALGRGLNSLMPQMNEQKEAVPAIPISSIFPNPKQPRKYFHEEQLLELAQSIKEKGILQPLIVTKQDEDHYIIIAGERRYRAALLADQDTVPVIIKTSTEEERIEIALIENIQREDLNAIEEAQGYRMLMDSFEYTQEDIAKKIGKSRSAIANTLRLLRLPEEIKKGIFERTISAGHARTLLTIEHEHHSQIHALYARIVDEGLSVRATELAVRKINQGNKSVQKKRGDRTDSKTLQYQQQISGITEMKESLIKTLGTKVEIKGSDESGKIEIQYYNKDDLNRLYNLLLSD